MLKRPRKVDEGNSRDEQVDPSVDGDSASILSSDQTSGSDGPVNTGSGYDDSDDSDDDSEDGEEDSDASWFDSETKSFLASMFVHLGIVLALASYTVVSQPEILSLFITSQPIAEELAPLDIVNDIAYSEAPTEEIGANSVGLTDMALSTAETLADVSEIPSVELDMALPNATVQVSLDIKEALGLTESTKAVRGMTGVGETGTEGDQDSQSQRLEEYHSWYCSCDRHFQQHPRQRDGPKWQCHWLVERR